MVEQALPGTPAARAGITAGDVIVGAGGNRVSSPSGLQSALERFHPGNHVSITWTDQAGDPLGHAGPGQRPSPVTTGTNAEHPGRRHADGGRGVASADLRR